MEKPTEYNGIRQFSTGATRSSNIGKLNYIKGLCPYTLEAYLQYLDKHRRQSDGNLRDWDNWKQGIPTEEYLASLFRHLVCVWQAHDTKDIIDAEDACALVFNALGLLRNVVTGAE